MDENAFWKLIESEKTKSQSGDLNQAKIIQSMLEEFPPDEIVDFERIFRQYFAQAYSWDLWGAAYVIGGGCSDDGFLDFRGGLIAHGRDTFLAALKDPESLADVPEPGVEEFEDVLYAARRAYEAVTGTKMPQMPNIHPRIPTGEPWKDEQLAERFPKLTKRYG